MKENKDFEKTQFNKDLLKLNNVDKNIMNILISIHNGYIGTYYIIL